MKQLFKFIAKVNERKAEDEFFRKEYEKYLKTNTDQSGPKRLAPMLYVIEGGKNNLQPDLTNQKKSS